MDLFIAVILPIQELFLGSLYLVLELIFAALYLVLELLLAVLLLVLEMFVSVFCPGSVSVAVRHTWFRSCSWLYSTRLWSGS